MYTSTRSHVNRRYSRAVRALVDIQDIIYPSGYTNFRLQTRRMPNGYPTYRLGNVALPSPIDEGYDSDEAKCHKRMHFIKGIRVIRRLMRNMWVKRKWRRLLYFLCWVCKRKSEDAEPLAEGAIPNIAEYVGRFAIIDHTAADHRLVFAPPYREWQSSKVQTKERVHGPYPLRKL